MSSALRAFMNGLVDYAGLFPPATLDMETAVKQYAGFRGQAEAWMLGRFIVQADRLPELAVCAEKHLTTGSQWGVSALLGHREDAAKSLAILPAQCRAIVTFEAELAELAAVEVLEVSMPGNISPEELPTFLNAYLDGLKDSMVQGRELFWELPPSVPEKFELPLLKVVADLASARSGSSRATLRLGAKLRCGGVTPEAFPSVERVARVVAHCRDLDLPLKCTAGLHHPIRHQAQEPKVMMHGFLNVFGAGLLAHAHGWDADQLARVIADTEEKSFHFDAGQFSWRDHNVQADAVRSLRSQYLCGFGSCSFDDPRDDLQNLGLL